MTRLFEAKPFLIAEVGSNWASLEQCLKSIEVAKECGADAVKFQAFTHEALYGKPRRVVSPVQKALENYYELPLEWLPVLKAHADQVGIEFMCTAFSPELVAAVDPYVEVHKIASSDCCWPQLLGAVAKTGKPVLLSYGAASSQEIVRAVQLFQSYGGSHVTLMHCIAAYPADCNLRGPVPPWNSMGLSDHTLGYEGIGRAWRDYDVIEKHFTAFPDLDTPDRPHSLTPNQFAAMVKLIRTGEAPDQEREFRLRHKRRLIATTDIPQGGILRYGESFGAYRSLSDDTRGLSPFRWQEVEGKKASLEIKRGTPIGEGDYQ